MTQYQFIVGHRDLALKLGGAMFGFALVLVFMPHLKVPAAALVGVMAMMMCQAYILLTQMARLQSALDMKRIMRGETPE